jgi:ribosomal protein S18 acetylase RimI-like enzyme
MNDLRIRPAALGDLSLILRHRRRMFEDMGEGDPVALDAMEASSLKTIARGLEDGSWRGFVAEEGGDAERRVVASGAVLISAWPGQPQDPQPRRATILNVYTERDRRRRGIARKLMEHILEFCRSEGLAQVSLHASDDGRPLYEDLGFRPSNEMRLRLR